MGAKLDAGCPSTAHLDAERPSLERHLEFMVELYGDARVARWHYPGDLGGVRTAEQSRELLESKIQHWADHGFGYWLWRERSSGELVGRVGLGWTSIEDELAVEVGWSVIASKHGQGFATEAARASLEFGFSRAGLTEIVSFTWIENVASLRVIEKLGMRRVREFEYAGLPHVLFAAQA
jgi:RimJ/RimL family protein N-acetyltransferase